MAVHLLHIGKTGGTALKTALARAGVTTTALGELVLHDHGTTLAHIPAGDVAICFLRDPVARFVSAFDSRRRMGRPRYLSRWTWREAVAFARFPSARSLADALADGRRSARFAMTSIRHLDRHYSYWLGDVDDRASRVHRLVFVGRQETFERDVVRLGELLGLDEPLVVPTDPVAAHRRPRPPRSALTERGVAAVTAWYRDDSALLDELTGTRSADER